MPYLVRPMRLEDIDQVTRAERDCFSTPWPAQAYRRELRDNRLGRYIVLVWEDTRTATTEPTPESFEQADDLIASIRRTVTQLLRPLGRPAVATAERSGQVVGFAGMWLMLDEAHITTICVRSQLRGRGFGELLLVSLIEAAMELQARRVTLEVRVSNAIAQQLYRKYTFHEEGIRKRYYSDNGEDALIMWSDRIDTPEFRERFDHLKADLARRVNNQQEVPPDGS